MCPSKMKSGCTEDKGKSDRICPKKNKAGASQKAILSFPPHHPSHSLRIPQVRKVFVALLWRPQILLNVFWLHHAGGSSLIQGMK
ncbi:mCG146993 [Mus musculus]|nr:mCG146993 [Mus musculus]